MSLTTFPPPEDPGSDPGTARAIEDAGSVVLPDGTPIGYGVADGVIEAPGDADWFAVELAAGETYAVGVAGAANGGGDLADPVLTVYDTHGTPVAQNDDFVTTGPDGSPVVDLDPLLGFTAPASGTYYVGASAYGEATGSYTAFVLGDPGTVALPVYAPPDDPTGPAWLFDLPSG